MAGYLDTLVFGIYPYVALAVLVVGSIVRYDREPYTWRSGSSQVLRRRQLIAGSVLFHVGVIVVFFGHLVGLLTPIQVFEALGIGHGFKQLMAIVVGGVAGVAALVGATLLAHRRFFDPRVRAQSSFSDNLVIAILWVQLALGLLTIPISLGHLDGEEMVKLMMPGHRASLPSTRKRSATSRARIPSSSCTSSSGSRSSSSSRSPASCTC